MLFAFLSCKKENAFDCFKSNGSEVSEVRNLPSFKSVEVSNKIDVMILKGSEFKVEVVAGKHIISNISTKVENGDLKIRNNNECNFVRGYKRTIRVNITLPHLEIIKNDGVGTVRFADDFAQDTLVVRAESSGDIHVNGTFGQIRTSSHGNGDIYINGRSKSLLVYSNGTNFLYAKGLTVKDYVYIETLSIGDCHIKADSLGQLDYNIQDTGNLYYTGEPGLVQNVASAPGAGRAIRE